MFYLSGIEIPVDVGSPFQGFAVASLAMTQSVSQVRQCKNIQKNRLSRGKRFVGGACPYFFGMSLLILFENQQDNMFWKSGLSLLFSQHIVHFPSLRLAHFERGGGADVGDGSSKEHFVFA